MAVIETDDAWWAIVVSYCILLGFTVGIGLRDNSWDTISSMVARSELTLTGFAMATLFITACQIYWVKSQFTRWSSNGVKWTLVPLESTLVTVGIIMSVVGTLGFGVVSTKLLPDEHLRFAATSFIGVLLYQLGIALLSVYNDQLAKAPQGSALHNLSFWIARKHPQPHSPWVGLVFWTIGVVSLVMLGQDKPYWWEYILVTSLHVSALAFTIPPAQRIYFMV